MSLETEIVQTLQNHPGMAALVVTRIYPMLMPQNPTLPAIVYQKISGPRSYSHSGDQNLTFTRYQFSCWAHTYAGAKALAAQLRDCLSGRKYGVIRASFCVNELDDYDPISKDFRIIVDFHFWVAEA